MAASTPVPINPGTPAPVSPATPAAPPSGGASAAAAASATTHVAGGPARASAAAATPVTSAPSTHSGKKVSWVLVVLTVVLVLGNACLAGWFVWKTIHTPTSAATPIQDTPASQVRAPNALASKITQMVLDTGGNKIPAKENHGSFPLVDNQNGNFNGTVVNNGSGTVYMGSAPSPEGVEYISWPNGKEMYLPDENGKDVYAKVKGVWICPIVGGKTQLNYVTWYGTKWRPIICDGLNRESGKSINEDKGKPEPSTASTPDKAAEVEKPQAQSAVVSLPPPTPKPEAVQPPALPPANQQTNPSPPLVATEDPSKALAALLAEQQKKQMEESARRMDQMTKRLEETHREIDELKKQNDPVEINRRLLERLKEDENLPSRCPEELREKKWTYLPNKKTVQFVSPDGQDIELSVWWMTNAEDSIFFVQDAKRHFWKMTWNEKGTKATCVPYKKE